MRKQIRETSVNRELTSGERDAIAGGQQVVKHAFAGAVNRTTGPRPCEPSVAATVAGATPPDPK